MISKVDSIIITCDVCEDHFEDSSGFSIFGDKTDVDFSEQEWHDTHDGKHYCPKCYHIDDNDNLIFHEKTDPGSTLK